MYKSLKERSNLTLFSITFLYAGLDKILKIYESFGPVYNLERKKYQDLWEIDL